jgi:hydroxymethylpyrimidine/phosphomethylpyrimidine kinase
MSINLAVSKEMYYNIKELHQLTNIPIATLKHWCNINKLKHNKPGRDIIIKGEWLLDVYK